jgi:hypothetical protein
MPEGYVQSLRPSWPLLREPEFKKRRAGVISATPVSLRSAELLYKAERAGARSAEQRVRLRVR